MISVLSPEQQQIIDGSLLGDGHIAKRREGNSYFIKSQCAKHKAYLGWHMETLGQWSLSLREYSHRKNSHEYHAVYYTTHAHEVFTTLRNKWYPQGKKIVPVDLTLTPLNIAIWFFDDGHNNLAGRNCYFATNAFTQGECEHLIYELSNFKIESTYVCNRIYIRSKSYKEFVNLITPYMKWDCFNHKIQYRDSQTRRISNEDVHKMVSMHEKGASLKNIAAELGVSISAVSTALRGYWKKHLGVCLANPDISLNNTSGISGVSWDKKCKKWVATFRSQGKRIWVGRFISKEKAATALLKTKESINHNQ